MSELEGIYTIWLREIIRFWRDKSRIISSLVQPLLFLVVFGGGFSFVRLGGLNYQTFLFPGIVVMSLVGVSIASGVSVIWDREFGFLKEILVAPVSRTSIFIGKALGGCTTALIQGLIILSLSFLIGIPISPLSFLVSIGLMAIISLGLVSIGLIIASLIETFESFGVIMNFIIFPLIFLSGAFFPLQEAPEWLKIISFVNPLTYGVEAIRFVIIGFSSISFSISLTVISVFSLTVILLGGIAFNRQK
ncbi:MAG: ABC transporter permease [Candidatus Aenigmatarchaeota archaeon]